MAGPTDRLSSERFLVILDISAAMQKRATNVSRLVGQMFAAGLNGQLHRGDTIGIWTYNNELHSGEFPLQRWSPQSVREITTAITLFVRKQSYRQQSRLAPVMKQMTDVVADSDKITVILVSDGSEAPVGTPFDAQVSDAFKLNAAEQRRQAMPFVTVLRAVKGKYVGCQVNTPPWPLEFPPFPVELPPATPAPTNVPKAMAEVPPTARPVTNVIARPSLIIMATNPVVAVPTPTNPPPVVESMPPPVDQPMTNPPPTVVTASVTPPINSGEVPESSPPEPMVANAKATKILPILPIAVGVAITLIGVVILGLVLRRRSRETTRVSLITHSINKPRK